MSKYTTELRYICESLAGDTESADGNNVEVIILRSIPHIFTSTINIVDENTTHNFKRDFLRHFYFREIGFETFGLFKVRLNEKLVLNQDYYSKLILAQLKLEEPDKTGTKIKKGHKKDAQNEERKGTNIDTIKNNEISKFSDTPQGGLSGLLNDTYLTTATNNTADNKNTHTIDEINKNTVDNNYEETETGVSESMADLVIKYENAIKSAELQIFNDLEELFMGVW